VADSSGLARLLEQLAEVEAVLAGRRGFRDNEQSTMDTP